jgi:hypothetical protein
MPEFIKCPRSNSTILGSTRIACPDDAWSIQLLGGAHAEGVTFTHDQKQGIEKWAGIDKTIDGDNIMHQAGSFRNAARLAKIHGMRIMAFLAGNRLLEPGEDPVQFLAGALQEAGFDVPYWDDEEE